MVNHLQKLLDTGDAKVEGIHEQWIKHTNRRTIAVLCLLAAVLYYTYHSYISAPAAFPVGTLVTISDDASLSQAANELQQAGVVRSAFALKATVVLFRGAHKVHAGDYLFKDRRDVLSVARAIIAGAYGLEPMRFRIPEGATVREMAAIYDKQLLRFNPDTFVEKATPYEGYLFPDTYFFLPNTSEDKVIAAMRDDFEKHITDIQPQIVTSGHSLAELVTMASLLEREARTTTDRQMIAGVLWNRIARRMPLQVDAAFLYSSGKNTFQLTMADLRTDEPYNTYTRKGLPPTPIGSPSLNAILAAAAPTQNSYLYYLADKNGVTHYSKTYAEHLRLKARYLGT